MTMTSGTRRRTVPTRSGPTPTATGLPPAPIVALPKARRRPALLALGGALMSLGILGGAWLVAGAGNQQDVLAVARAVPFGAVITPQDLVRTKVSHDPAVATVPTTELGQMVGRIAATNLTPGSLLTRAAVTDQAPPLSGQVLVAIALPATRLPAGSLQAGDRVLVVDTPAAGADAPTIAPTTIAATVVRLGPPDLNGVTVLDVTVANADGPALAARTGTGRIALVLQPRGR